MKFMQKMVLLVVVLAATINLAVSMEATNPKLIAALKEYAESAPNEGVRFIRLVTIMGYFKTVEERMEYLDGLLPECKTPAQKNTIAIQKAAQFVSIGRVKDAVAIYEALMDGGNDRYISQIIRHEADPAVALKYKQMYLLNQLGVRAPRLNSTTLLFVLKSIRPDECDDYAAFLDDVLRFYRVFMIDSPNLIPFITQVEATRKQLGDSPAVTPAVE